jgi:hypothetical protein
MKKRQHSFFSIVMLLFLVFTSLKAQSSIYTDSLAKKYDRSTIYLRNSTFEKNGKRTSVGFLKYNLGNELKNSLMAHTEFKKSRTNTLVSIGLSLLGSFVTISSINNNRINKTQYILGLSTMAASIPFGITGQNQLQRSVWLYNRDAIVR